MKYELNGIKNMLMNARLKQPCRYRNCQFVWLLFTKDSAFIAKCYLNSPCVSLEYKQ